MHRFVESDQKPIPVPQGPQKRICVVLHTIIRRGEMKKQGIIMGVVLLVVLVGMALSVAQAQYEVLEVKMREVQRSENTITISWLAKIKNNTNTAQRVLVKIQFLDKDGFQLFDAVAEVALQPEATTSVTDNRTIDLDIFSQIKSIQAKVD
jgi:hypothetical protein